MQLTDQSPVDKVLGSVYGKTRKQVKSRVDQEKCIAYQDRRRIRSETWNDWINGRGCHGFGQVDDDGRETQQTSVSTDRSSGGMKAYLRRMVCGWPDKCRNIAMPHVVAQPVSQHAF
jgi:hypothetical protein